MITLGECFTWGSGGTPRRSVPAYYNGDIPWAVIGDLNDGPVDTTRSSISLAGLENSSAKWVAQGSVLLAMYGSIGKLGITSAPLTTNQAIAHTQPSPVPTRYLFWYLRRIRGDLTNHGKGGTQQNISQTVIKAIPFPLAPLAEQHHIVSKIKDLFAKLDAGVTALKRAQEKLERYRVSVLKAAVEGTLTEPWRKENPPKESGEELLGGILAERRKRWEDEQLTKFEAQGKRPPKNWKKKYKEPMEPDASKFPELLEEWCWASLGQVAEFQNGRAFPSKEYVDSGVRLLRPGNLDSSGRVYWSEKNTRHMPEEWAERFPQYIVGSGELVMNLTAQSLKDEFLGRVVETAHDEHCLLNQRLARIQSLPGLNPRFLLAVLRARRFRRFVDGLNTGSLIQHMFTSQLHEFVFPLPPQSEQEVIVARVDRLLTDCSTRVASLDHALRTCSILRQSILKRAFEGRLVPQDPNDEPASVLLERIRAEWEAGKKKTSRRPAQPKHKR